LVRSIVSAAVKRSPVISVCIPARIPAEESGGSGAISKQGNTMVRSLLIETVHHAARQDPELRQDYQRVSSLY
jgi:hypothetical protein